MQQSPCEIKDKLLRALDKEYNVVDMAAVFEVISSLEKTTITRDTLEKTRIGKYINGLRKRTCNEQLARRAKDLVRSWRQLLSQGSSINGERSISNIGTSVLGPGPGPGFGPGPGPGKFPKTSPFCERSASPFCSSASNSPQLTMAKLQVPSRTSMPSTYAPANLNQVSLHNDKSCIPIKKDSNIVFKPVSPALAAVQYANAGLPVVAIEPLPQPKPQSICISPSHLNSSHSCSPHSDSSAMKSPSESSQSQLKYEEVTSSCLIISAGSTHSSLETAKTNVANKRLRKNTPNTSKIKRRRSTDDSAYDATLQNGTGTSESSEKFMPSESSAFKSFSSKCGENTMQNVKGETKSNASKLEKSKVISEIQMSDLLKEKLGSLSSGAKLTKVKTTQQLIKELKARKDAMSNSFPNLCDLDSETNNYSWKESPNDKVPNAELLRSKSELMKKFLSSSQESLIANSEESPVMDRVSPLSDNVPSKSSVITSDKDVNVPYIDPIAAEIDQILSNLPPINVELINLNSDEEPLPERKASVSDSDLERLSNEQWECVNGCFAADGSWRSWEECTEVEISAGETFKILPYVNID